MPELATSNPYRNEVETPSEPLERVVSAYDHGIAADPDTVRIPSSVAARLTHRQYQYGGGAASETAIPVAGAATLTAYHLGSSRHTTLTLREGGVERVSLGDVTFQIHGYGVSKHPGQGDGYTPQTAVGVSLHTESPGVDSAVLEDPGWVEYVDYETLGPETPQRICLPDGSEIVLEVTEITDEWAASETSTVAEFFTEQVADETVRRTLAEVFTYVDIHGYGIPAAADLLDMPVRGVRSAFDEAQAVAQGTPRLTMYLCTRMAGDPTTGGVD